MKAFGSPISLFASYILVFCSSYMVNSLANSGSRCRSKDSKGTEFIVGFLDTLGADNTYPSMYVVGASRTRTVVNIDAPGMNMRSIIDGGAPYKKLEITGSSGPSSRAVLVTADHDINLYCVDQGTSMDSYLALPTDVLGTEYYVASYTVPERIRRQDRGSQFMIMGVEQNTRVEITLKGTAMHNGRTYQRGTPLSLSIDRLQVLHFLSEDDDLTGTHIMSDAPVGVISGNKCADVPARNSFCDHLVEMIPPVSTWGRKFITSPLRLRTAGDVFRVIASRDGTIVEIEGAGTERRRLNAGEFQEFDVASSDSRFVSASKPALLIQYSKGGEADNTQADPFMMLVPAIEQFPRDPVYFVTPLSSSPPFSHHVNVIVDCQKTGALFHNMFLIPETAFSRLTQLRRRVGDREYCIAQMDLAIGEHMLEQRELDVQFSIVLYGFATSDGNTQTIGEVAYGMPIGLTLNDNSCYASDSIVYDTSTQRNSRQTGPGEITRAGDGPFVSFPGQGDVSAPVAPSYGAGQEKSGRYLMLAILIGMFSLSP
ncbi:IgGFc-binding protein-like [Amphiura filiformis]|uniref:IgGFc-binding protein-like n=1 Tax=Amphiura filiformis TaxID=82378 RepID=UPI003B221D59